METCCAAGTPVTADYTPKGRMEQLGDLPVYLTGDPASGKAIIGFYDIFGFDFPQVKQVADRLAAAGFLVALPDVFRGKPWPKSKFPPKPEDNLLGWIDTHGGWEKVTSKDTAAVVDHLKSLGITRFASLGFCWGADIAIRLAADPATFSAGGFCHPSWFGKERELAAAVKCPVAVCSAQGDPLEAVQEVLQGTPWGPKSVFRRFGDMTHGYCAARGDFSKLEVAAAVGETIKLLTEFYKANV